VSVIWWTLYILVALTMLSVWVQAMAFLGVYLKARRERLEGTYSGMTRKSIEALVRMEIRACLSKLEVSSTAYPGLGKEKIEIRMKEDK